MRFKYSELDDYVENHTNEEPELLAELRKETFQKTINPQMISGAYQGRILSMISKIIRPENILEIGTFTGYATLCLAEGLQENGKIITIDKNDELSIISDKYFQKSKYSEQIYAKTGDALVLIKELKPIFDLVFIDADKKNYLNYYELILPKLNSGGVILADNVLWWGKVLDETPDKDKTTKLLQEFNKSIAKDKRVEVVMLPVRDGISLIRKK